MGKGYPEPRGFLDLSWLFSGSAGEGGGILDAFLYAVKPWIQPRTSRGPDIQHYEHKPCRQGRGYGTGI